MNPRFLRFTIALLAVGSLMIWTPSQAPAQMGVEYSFRSSSNPYTSISGGTVAIAGNATTVPSIYNENQTAGPYAIGFNFAFGCNTYTQFSVTSSGYLTLGGTVVANSYVNNLAGAPLYPIIAPFWERQHYYNTYAAAGCPAGGPVEDVGVSYLLSGTAPNRVLTVEWKTNLGGDAPYWITCGVPAMHTYQVRMYEGSNQIIFHYGVMIVPGNVNANSSASIGLATATSDFISVTPGAPASISSTTSNNTFNNRLSGIATGTTYTFTPDRLVVAGRTGAGNEGVANPVNGSTLLGNVVQSIATQMGYTPLDLRKACAAPNMPLMMTITGSQASEYSFDATGTQSWNTTLTTNTAITPRINFRPLGGGIRSATLTVTNQLTNQSLSYSLAGQGVPRIVWIGHTSEGGTAAMADGDVLLDGVQVVFGNSQTFRPFSLQNILSPSIPAPSAQVTYTLIDPTGSYSIVPTSDALDGGEISTPDIIFSATTGVGTQEATLIVSADGERRMFRLRAFAAAPGGLLYANGVQINSSNPLFVGGMTCVGEQVISTEITAVNTGTGDFIINGLDAFLTENEIAQGTPPYPLLRDAFGNPVQTWDYFLTEGPGVAPRSANAEFQQLVIPEGETRRFYLNAIPTRPDKRYAHLFFRTNGFNLSDPNANDVPTRGLVRAGAFASGIGSYLEGEEQDMRPKPVVIPGIDVRDTQTVTARISNTGDCDLRISKSEFRFSAGDVHDFELVSVFPNTSVSGDDYVMAPGATDSVMIRFIPESYGSRRVTLRMVTNDSTLGGDGVNERGVYYWDIYGKGEVGIEARNLQLPPAVINGNSTQGFVLLENTSDELVEILGMNLTGGNGDIIQHSTRPWPSTFPVLMKPGEQMRIWVELRPDPTGAPGNRDAELVVQLVGGRQARAQIRGYVGTRTLLVQPSNLFMNTRISVGEIARQFVAVTNTGTLPINLNDPSLTETNPGDYQISPLVRHILEPGQTELIEVSYTPQGVGISSGTLSFISNATNGVQTVTLGGEGTGTTIGNPNIPTVQATPGDGFGRRTDAASAVGLHLYGIVPNPTAEKATIRYTLPRESEMHLEVYDASGRLLKEIAAGLKGAGEHTTTVDLSTLPNGFYNVTLTSGDGRESRVVHILR